MGIGTLVAVQVNTVITPEVTMFNPAGVEPRGAEFLVFMSQFAIDALKERSF